MSFARFTTFAFCLLASAPFISAAPAPSASLVKRLQVSDNCNTDPAYSNLNGAISKSVDWARTARDAANGPSDPYFDKFFSQVGGQSRPDVAAMFDRMINALTSPDSPWTLECGTSNPTDAGHCDSGWGMGTYPDSPHTFVCPSFPTMDPSWDDACDARGPASVLMHENLLIHEQGVSDSDGYVWVYYAQALVLQCPL